MANLKSAETVVNIDGQFVGRICKQREVHFDEEQAKPRVRMIKASSASISCSIHRVPQRFFHDKKMAYVPHTISIGPFHYHQREYHASEMNKDRQPPIKEQEWKYIKELENHKRRYLEGKHCVDLFYGLVNEHKKKARDCYSEDFELGDEQFVEMMVLDGCFIIELFRRTFSEEKAKENGEENFEERTDDPLIKWEWLRKQLALDLLLLENQIPLFILELLSPLMNISRDFLLEMAIKFFRSARVLPISVDAEIKIPNVHFHHLLHLVHASILSTCEKKKNPRTYTMKLIPCATDLKAVGIKFQKAEEPNRCFLDIEFKSQTGLLSTGVIKIPQLTLSTYTGTVFLNLAAFEQSYRHCGTAFSAYIVFMDCLIANEEDVRVLSNHGVDNFVGSNKDLVDLLNTTGRKLIVEDDETIYKTLHEISMCYEEVTKHRILASIKRNFAKNPMQFISIVIGVLSLIIPNIILLANFLCRFFPPP